MATVTRLKRRLGSFLREVRKRADMTAEQAGAELKQDSGSMISRYESGEVLPPWSTVRILLDCYGAAAEELEQASGLYDDAKDEPRSVRLPAGAPKAFRKLINAEREAVRERALAPYVIPGLLQTKRYAQALEDAAHLFYEPDMRPDKWVATRMTRQKPLDGPDPMALHALLDESAVRREIGGPDVYREQLEHLLAMAERPNITVQVIPFKAGGYGTMNGSFIIVDYPEPDTTPGVYLEYPAGGAWVDDKDVQRFTTTFDQATARALSPTDTTHLIHQLGTRRTNDHRQHPVA